MSASHRATMLPPAVRRTRADPGEGDGEGDGDATGDTAGDADCGAPVAASSADRTDSTLPMPNALSAAVHMAQAPSAKTHRPPRMRVALPGAWESTPDAGGGPEGDLGRAGFGT